MTPATPHPRHLLARPQITEGDLRDPHGEFFVVANPRVGVDDLWRHKYQLDLRLKPAFVPECDGVASFLLPTRAPW